jgi:hypothetical protein
MRLLMGRTTGVLVLGVACVVLFAACGGPDTEDQTLTEARQTLEEAGVPQENITLTGSEAESGDPDTLIVCDQEPDAADPDDTVVLQVSTNCPNDDGGGKKKKRGFGKKRR